MTPWREWIAATAPAVVTAAMSAFAFAISLAGSSSDHSGIEAAFRALMVAAPLAVGFYARGLPNLRRFGNVLVVAGAGVFLANLSSSDDDLAYSIGRVCGWLVEVVLVYLVLAFPSGSLGRTDRALVGATALVVALLYLPTALLAQDYPTPSPWTACTTDCPGNAFMLTSSEPAFVGDLVRPLRELLTVAIFAAATVRLGWRIERASHLMRRMLVPVLSVAMLRLAVLAVGMAVRHAAPEAGVTEVLAWLIALMVPALAVAFLVGLVGWRLFIAAAMERLAVRLRGHAGPGELRDALAEAFTDPSLDVVYWLEEPQPRWADAGGNAVDPASLRPGAHVTEVSEDGRRVAAIVHDPALAQDEAFVESATSYAAITLDNHRLTAQTSALLREASDSRWRIQAAADRERIRIEHDLHDGAQQRLVALRIKLEIAAEQAGDGDPPNAARLRTLGREVDEALEEVRSLARGIYPGPLAARGLVEALRSAALRAALPTTVLAAGIGRYSREVESAAYFCCLEAIQNADKHATGASAAVIELTDNGSLTLEVRDDGAGFELAHTNGGVGLTGMRDRLAAVGGRLTIHSRPGRGTHLTAVIPH